jgi:hypothetical protein
MSFDLFVQCFENGKDAQLPAVLVLDAFRPFVKGRDEFCLTVGTGQDVCYVYVEQDAEQIEGFSINRPIDDEQVNQALVALLQKANLAILVPGDCPPLVGRAETVAHIPSDVVEALGQPKVIASASELVRCIRES